MGKLFDCLDWLSDHPVFIVPVVLVLLVAQAAVMTIAQDARHETPGASR